MSTLRTRLYLALVCTIVVGCDGTAKEELQVKELQVKETHSQKWYWTANIQSEPLGAKVYCVSDPNENIYIGKTPIDVEIYTLELKGVPGQLGVRTDTYNLPTRRIEDGFLCIFKLVQRNKTKEVVAFDNSELSKDATGGLAYDLRQGKYILFQKGSMKLFQHIPQDYKVPAPFVNKLSADFNEMDTEEVK